MTSARANEVEVEVEILVEHRGDAGDAWPQQKAGLYGELRRVDGVVAVERRERAVAGTKGGTADIIMTLATTGTLTAAITAVASVARAWIERDKARDVKLRIGDVVLDARAVDATSLEKIARQARRNQP